MKYARVWIKDINRWATSGKNPHGIWPVNSVNKAIAQLKPKRWYQNLEVVIFELKEVERKDV